MLIPEEPWFRLASALAIGLLIGAERERRKGEGPLRSPAGIRTFAVGSLLGGLSFLMGREILLAVSTMCVALFCYAGYRRTQEQDPGLTTETALLLTVLLGGLAQRDVATASGIAVVVTILLAARTHLHRLVRAVLSEVELTDALVFAAAVLVVLPLMPNRYLGPYGAINPRIIWKIIILLISISACGYIAVRLLGARLGLPMAGLASGFVSSTATIGSMATRSAADPALLWPAVSGAILSTVATMAEMAIVLWATNGATLRRLAVPLIFAGVAAVVYGALLTLFQARHEVPETHSGRPFSIKTALLLGGTLAVILVLSAALNARLGRRGVLAAATVSGFADPHAASVSVASLVAAGKLDVGDADIPILGALTANTLTKIIVAISAGQRRFALYIVPGLLLVCIAAWLGLLFS
jgi:uncharacterized membrane protein (DUF4010 family)